MHPISGVERMHYGEDTVGAGNWAPVTGTVLFAGYDTSGAGFGNAVAIREKANPRYVWWCAHHASLAVHVGQEVTEGTTRLGVLGATGAATGPHVHTECRDGGSARPLVGTAINPRSRYTTTAGGGVEIIMDWGDSIPTRDPAKGFAATGIRVPVSEILAYIEAYGKGLYKILHRKPENPQQTDGQTNDIGTLVAFTEANTSYARGQLTAIARTADEVKAIVEKLGAPTSIQVTVPPESIKAALLDPDVIAALRGPTLEQIVAAVDASDDDEHAAILAGIAQLPDAALASLGLQRREA